MAFPPGEMIAIAIIFSIMPLIVVSLRLWARRIINAKYAMDDYFVFFGLAFCIASGITITIGATCGLAGQHQTPGPIGVPAITPRLATASKVKYATQILTLLSFGSAKLSVLYLYRRILTTATFSLITNILLVVVAAWTLSFFCAIIFQCGPVNALWTLPAMEQQPFCAATKPVFYANTISDLLLNVLILVLPIPIIYNISSLPQKQKLAIGGMFALGTLVCVSSAVRLVVFVQFVPGLPLHITNPTYYESPFAYWSLIEASLGVVGASLPVLRPIFVRPKPGYLAISAKLSLPTAFQKTTPVFPGWNCSNPQDPDTQDPFHDRNALVISPLPSWSEKEVCSRPTPIKHMASFGSNLSDTSSASAGRFGPPLMTEIKRKAVPLRQAVEGSPLAKELPRLPWEWNGGLSKEKDDWGRRVREGKGVVA